MIKRFFTLALLFSAPSLFGQAWTGVLAPSRGIDWTQAGAASTPNRSTVCATLSAGASFSAINSAIAACPANGVVSLGAGTFTGSGQIIFNSKSNVTLRGAGPTKTTILWTGIGACNGLQAAMCIYNGDSANGNPPNEIATWTAGYSQGATSLTLGAVTKGSISTLHVGTPLILDQLDDASDPGNLYHCAATSVPCSQQGGIGNGRLGRGQTQTVVVTSISGSGPWTIGFTPGLYASNWVSGKSPGAWWSQNLPVTGDSIENLTMDFRGSHCSSCGNPGGLGVQVVNGSGNWVNNIRSLNDNQGVTEQFMAFQSVHNTVQNSYFFGSNPSSEGYGVDCAYNSSDNLYQNNIFHHIASPLISQGCTGSVYAYNYAINDYFFTVSTPNYQQQDAHHSVGDEFNLFEGNQTLGLSGDDIHGTSNLTTVFRNYYNGRDPSTANGVKTAYTIPIFLLAFNRYWNIVGNVLGTAGYHTTYQTVPATSTSCTGGSQSTIYTFGYSDQNQVAFLSACSFGPPNINNDLTMLSTEMRWDNYDTVNAAVRQVAGENGSSAPVYPALASPSTTLAASWAYNSRPSWYSPSSIPFPAAGPDVTGGNVPNVGGHVYLNPAANCYLNTLGGPTGAATPVVLPYDFNTCFTSSPTVSLTVATGGSGTGTIASSTCTGTGNYAPGTACGPYTATATGGSTFSGWSSSGSATCSGTGTCGPFSLAITTVITATFTGGTSTCGDPFQNSPNFSGTYNSPPTPLPLSVGFTSPTAGCNMFATFDGSAPTCSSASYGGTSSLSATTVIRVIACQGGFVSSTIKGGTWTIVTSSIPPPPPFVINIGP